MTSVQFEMAPSEKRMTKTPLRGGVEGAAFQHAFSVQTALGAHVVYFTWSRRSSAQHVVGDAQHATC